MNLPTSYLAGLALTSTFLAGLASGMAVEQLLPNRGLSEQAPPFAPWPPQPALGSRGPERMSRGSTEFLEMQTLELELSREQADAVHQVMLDHRERMNQTMSELRPQMESHMASFRGEIRDLLTTAQTQVYDKLTHPVLGRGPGAAPPRFPPPRA